MTVTFFSLFSNAQPPEAPPCARSDQAWQSVHQNNTLRLHRDHSCDRHAALLTAGKFIRRGRPIFVIPTRRRLSPTLSHISSVGIPIFFRSETNIFFYDSSDDLVVRILKYHSRALSHVPQILRIFLYPVRPPIPVPPQKN